MSTFAAEVVTAAGELLLDYFGQVSYVSKGRFDLVTRVDIAVEEFLVHRTFSASRLPKQYIGKPWQYWLKRVRKGPAVSQRRLRIETGHG